VSRYPIRQLLAGQAFADETLAIYARTATTPYCPSSTDSTRSSRTSPTNSEGRSMADVYSAVRASVAWLDAANGHSDAELTLRMLKVSEEAGEAAGAWIGTLGQNPRKGITHNRAQVAAELADVALTALVAIESLGLDAAQVLATCATKVAARIAESGPILSHDSAAP
jgi:NTP pyrophosphatase (non-canonical NTP hydrolase)